ncbi:hypothetical protein KJ765_05300 [Candidatus Micrarchaeota archaeon]|nr:hypothetical protein [Candidatus Micrarchaeota archaeon]
MSATQLLKNRRIQLVIVAVALALVLVAVNGLNLGIEFKGGVRIPISIISEQDLTSDQMTDTIETLKQRINKFGLSQSIVRPLGGKEIIVEIPQADASVIRSVERILRQQGRFEAVVDGNVGLEGTDIVQNAVGGPSGELIIPQGTTAQWELNFASSRAGGERFAQAAEGKENYPVYMYLDRPRNTAILVDAENLQQGVNFAARQDLEEAIEDLTEIEGDKLLVLFVENQSSEPLAERIVDENKTEVIIGKSLAEERSDLIQTLKNAGFTDDPTAAENRIVVKDDKDMIINSYDSQIRGRIVNEWKAIGLISAPVLSAGLADGYVSQFYSVTGSVSGVTEQDAQKNALGEIKLLKSVISGGKLPVSTVLGSAYVVAPSLGEQFLMFSAIAIFTAIIAVMGLIVWRYRRMDLLVPIILVNLVEIVLTTSFIGIFGTLDLAAVAGIVAIIGSGVDDQIIITDEVLRKRDDEEDELAHGRGLKDRIGKAFFIIFTVAGVAIVSMLPLLLSGIVEVMGFALATIVGIVLGVGLTRPAFGVIVEHIAQKRSSSETAP